MNKMNEQRVDSYWTTEHLRELASGESEQIAYLMDTFFPERKSLPRQGEIAAIAPADRRKTAALCYDRIWGIPTEDIPESIRCFGDTAFEREFLFSILSMGVLPISFFVVPEQPRYHKQDVSHYKIPKHTINWPLSEFLCNAIIKDLNEKASGLKKMHYNPNNELNQLAREFQRWFVRAAASSFSHQYDIPIIPISTSHDECFGQYSEGDRRIVVVTLENMNIVDDESLSWGQVLEFRADTEARKAYRHLLHWLDKEMIGKSASYIQDEIGIKLEQYEWSLRKHGIKTVLGSISQALDGKYLLGTSALAGSALLSGHPTLAILASSGLIIGKMVAKVSEALLDFADVERGQNSEISWIYEVKQHFSKKTES